MSEKTNYVGIQNNQGKRSWMILVASVAISLCGIGSAFAVAPTPAFTWDATGTSDYNTPTNWDPDLAGPPMNTDNQFLTINNGATAAINSDAQGAFLILGLSTGQSGNLVINGGTTSTFGEIRIGGRETVPDDYNSATPTFMANNGGTGSVIQNPGSTVNVNYNAGSEPPVASFYVGDSSGLAGNTANGSYTITGTAALPSVLLSGFANNDAIVVGTGSGTVGTFTQNAFTTVTSTGFVNVGRRGSTGTYNLNGGTLNAQAGNTNTALFVGDGDTTGIQTTSGTFNQASGTFNATGNAFVGRRGGDGFYNLSGGDLAITGTTGLVLGDGNDATTYPGTSGTFTQTGGTVTTSAVLVGRRSGVGVYKISAGSLTTSGDLRVPDIGSSTDANLFAAQGTLEISGTAAVTVGANMNIGLGNSGTAGSVVGTVNMTAGTLGFTAAAPIYAVGNGLGATATVNQSGGTVTMNAAANTGASNLDLGRNNSSGTYNLSGTGVVNAKTVTLESGQTANTTASRIFNVSGGTLNTTTFNFGTGLPGAGATLTRQLNVSGGNVTIGTLTTGQNATTYISGGTFNITNSLSLTSTSTLRTSVPLTLTPAIAMGTMTIQVDASALNLSGTISGVGNLTKTGAGTLIFSGTNTSTAGGTTISGGRLELAAATASVNPGNVTVNGAALGTSLAIDSGVANGIANTATLSLAGGGTVGLADQGYADLGSGVNERVAALLLGGTPQTFGLTFGSSASPAAIKSNEYFAGTGVVTVGTAGDYNNSGEVDAADYVTWRQNPAAFGNSAGYDLWRQNFGAVAVPGAGSSLGGNQAVPEPGTLLLTVLGVLPACARRRRR